MRKIVLFFGFLCAACGGENSEVSPARIGGSLSEDAEFVQVQGRTGGTLRYALAGEPSTFNFLAVRDVRTRLVAYLTTATLLEFDSGLQEVVSGICRSYEVSEDGRTVSLELRRGILFSDGVPFTADDVLFTFQSIYDQSSSNVLKETLLVDDEPLQVVKINEFAVEIRFPAPHAAAEYILSTVPILPRHRFQKDRAVEEYWTLDTPPEEMCGLGPFVVAVHEAGKRTVLRYNPHYWRVDSEGVQLPYLDELVLEYIPDRNNQLLRFKAGELDLLGYLLEPEDFRHLEQEESIETRNLGPSSNLAFYWFNLGDAKTPLEVSKRRWFTQRSFRQAINCAVDRQTIIKLVFRGLATEAAALVPSTNRNWYAEDLPRCDANPEEARSLLQAAGFSWRSEEGREILLDSAGEAVEFELLTTTSGVLGKIAAILQQDLGALGITITIRQEESRAVASRIMMSGDYDSALMLLDFPVEPVDIGTVVLSSGSMHVWNPGQESPATEWEEEVDSLMSEQIRTLDVEKRSELFRRIQRVLAEERPFIPLINKNILLAKSKKLKNVRAASIFPFSFWRVWEFSW